MTSAEGAPLAARWRPAASQGGDPLSGSVTGALVLLHGRGADEHDLFPLLDLLDPEQRLLGVTPGGPLHLPPGGRHWYALGGIPTPDPGTFFSTAPRLAAFLDSLPVPPGRIVLGGFSQGAVMSWAMSLGPSRPAPAAVVALSGFLPRVDGYSLDPERLAGLPVAVAHGLLDPVIPARFGAEASETLAAAGAEVLRLETAVPHMVDPAWLPPLRELVARATREASAGLSASPTPRPAAERG
jgi:phospholipase/carboxylesterase